MADSYSPPRLLVIGLDSVDPDLLAPWLDAGELPNLKGLIEGGTSGRLRSTIPYTTPAAWTTFTTGKNPGKHGVFNFTALQPGTYNVRLSNGSYCKTGTVWGYLNGRGWRVGAINIPWTYPPEKLDGYLMSGMDSPFFGPNVVSPRELFPEVEGVVEDFYYRSPRRGEDGSYGLSLLEAEISRVTRLTKHMMARHPTEAVMAVYTAADRIQHHFVKSRRAVAEDGRTFEDVVLHVYRLLDDAVGELVAGAGPDTLVVVASDHGAGPLVRAVNIAAALEELGMIRYGRGGRSAGRSVGRKGLAALYRGARSLLPARTFDRLKGALGERRHKFMDMTGIRSDEVDWEATRAFPLSGSQIRINLKGREPQGTVEPGREYEAVRNEIAGFLETLEDENGERLVRKVYRREEVWEGAALDDAPDLVVHPEPGIEFVRRVGEQLLPERVVHRGTPLEGNHRPEGVVILKGPKVGHGKVVEGMWLGDVIPTALHLLGEPIPSDMDGRAPKELEDGEGEASRYSTEGYARTEREPSAYTEADEEEIAERLRNLGYIE